MNYLEEVKHLFARSYASSVNESTSVNYDLQIMGEDADFYMQKFFTRFNVDGSTFSFERFFHQEFGVKYLYYRLFKPKLLDQKEPLTLGHLAEVAKAGRWFNPPQ